MHRTFTCSSASTWKTSAIRKWLNDDFINSAFTEDEKKVIANVTVENDTKQNCESYATSGGEDTYDQVYLLSYYEAFQRYFDSDADRMCIPTPYALARGAYIEKDEHPTAWWWLRSPGLLQNYASEVSCSGTFDSNTVISNGECIRPVLWVNYSAENFSDLYADYFRVN